MSRPRQGSYDSRLPSHRREIFGEIPPLQRTSSDPVSPRPPTKRDTAPAKGSTLKESQTYQHDSGYGSSSSPHTPEMRGDSPPRAQTTAKYKVRKDEDEIHRARKMTDDGGEARKFLSPEMAESQYHANHVAEEKRERRSSRSRDPEPRKKSPEARKRSPEPRARSGRPVTGERQPSFTRAHSSSRYDEQRTRKVPLERSPESFQHRVDPKTVKYSSHPTPSYARYDGHRTEAAFHRSMGREGRKIPSY